MELSRGRCEMEESVSQQDFVGKDRRGTKWRSVSDHVVDEDDKRQEFDCNICLDSVREPVVTRCGHLFCWPCLYKWLRVARQEDDDPRLNSSCPVCKSEVSQESLVPLFGRGETRSSASDNMVIPRRPLGLPSPSPPQVRRVNPHPHAPQRMGTEPSFGVVGELIHTGVFGTSTSNLLIYPTSYHIAASSPRARRQALQYERSITRIFFFLCCCAVFFFLFC